MATDKPRFSVTFTDETFAKIQKYQKDNNISTQSKAVARLVSELTPDQQEFFKIGSYWVFFWSNGNDPLEPIHVHACLGSPNAGATKIWITQTGRCYFPYPRPHSA